MAANARNDRGAASDAVMARAIFRWFIFAGAPIGHRIAPASIHKPANPRDPGFTGEWRGSRQQRRTKRRRGMFHDSVRAVEDPAFEAGAFRSPVAPPVGRS